MEEGENEVVGAENRSSFLEKGETRGTRGARPYPHQEGTIAQAYILGRAECRKDKALAYSRIAENGREPFCRRNQRGGRVGLKKAKSA